MPKKSKAKCKACGTLTEWKKTCLGCEKDIHFCINHKVIDDLTCSEPCAVIAALAYPQLKFNPIQSYRTKVNPMRQNDKVKIPQTIHEWPPLNEWKANDGKTKSKILARIVKVRDSQHFLDLREYTEKEDFQGFTSRGLRLTVKDMEKLRTIFNEAIERLEFVDAVRIDENVES